MHLRELKQAEGVRLAAPRAVVSLQPQRAECRLVARLFVEVAVPLEGGGNASVATFYEVVHGRAVHGEGAEAAAPTGGAPQPAARRHSAAPAQRNGALSPPRKPRPKSLSGSAPGSPRSMQPHEWPKLNAPWRVPQDFRA